MDMLPIPIIGTPPLLGSPCASGYDLESTEKVVILPGKHAVVPTGIKLSIPVGYEAQVRSRSGLAAKCGIMVLNSPGTIDADYRGEIKVILANFGDMTFQVEVGMRIAQIVFAPVVYAHWHVVKEFGQTVRGERGLGSTGV